MFVETITQPEDEWREWNGRLRLYSVAPPGLRVAIAWRVKDGTITSVHVWDEPSAVGDFYLARVREVVEELGEPSAKPVRRGEPVELFVRDQ